MPSSFQTKTWLVTRIKQTTYELRTFLLILKKFKNIYIIGNKTKQVERESYPAVSITFAI